MKKAVGAVLGLFGLWGCTTTPTSVAAAEDQNATVPLSSSESSLLGSFETNLKNPNGGRFEARVDFVNQAGKLALFLQGSRYGFPFTRTVVESVTDTQVTASLTLNSQPASLVVNRSSSDGSAATMVLTLSSGGPLGTSRDYLGPLEKDTTDPSFTQSKIEVPWEISQLGFSEGLLEKDVKLPVSGELAFSLVPIPDSPWVGAVGYRKPLSSTWDTPQNTSGSPQAIPELSATDPSGNAIKNQRGYFLGTIPVGKATKAYDFATDVPAFPSQINRLVGDCDGAAACMRVSQGAKVGFRIAAGQKVLRLRYALRAGTFEGQAPKSTVNLTAFLAPGDGSAPVTTKPIEVVWTPTPNPTDMRAFGTAYSDLEIPLPKIDAETGISLRFDGEPRENVVVDPQNPLSPIKARHMVLLVKNAVSQ
jgi:hypothetical protein